MTSPNDERTANPLLADVPAVIGILGDPVDFRAMHRLAAVPLDDYGTYLGHVEALLRSHTAKGQHTIAVLINPSDYTDFCNQRSRDPADPLSRALFTATEAASATHVVYEGQDLHELMGTLADRAAEHVTWDIASGLLLSLGACSRCGHDIGSAALQKATRLLAALLNGVGPQGSSRLVCSFIFENNPLAASLNVTHETADVLAEATPIEAVRYTTILAAALAMGGPGGVVMRTTPSGPDARERVCGWRILHGRLAPLTAAEVFDAYCTGPTPGDLVGPESGVDYCAGFELPEDTEEPVHRH
ncbi:hypothetical protein AB0M58_13255 [Streptomyces bobili]|uniref:hypothetical protein n=1 Tax=Streptomyces bobili TaxID=67280 RepID=UPI003444F63A